MRFGRPLISPTRETASDSSPVVSKLSLVINTNNERRLGTSQRQLASTVSS